jgi:hypothetical protein
MWTQWRHSSIQTLNIKLLLQTIHVNTKVQLTVSQTFLVQPTTQGNSDASTAGCRGPVRLQRKAAIMYFLQQLLTVYQISQIYIWSKCNLENQKSATGNSMSSWVSSCESVQAHCKLIQVTRQAWSSSSSLLVIFEVLTVVMYQVTGCLNLHLA